MTIRSNMTIEDYMRNSYGRFKVIRKDLKPQKEVSATSDSQFNGILSSFKKPSDQPEPKVVKGLTIADYKMRPVSNHYARAEVQTSAKIQTSSPEKSSYIPAVKEVYEYMFGPEIQQEIPSLQSNCVNNAEIIKDTHPKTALKSLDTNIISSNKVLTEPKNISLRTKSTKIEKAIQDAAAKYQLSPKLIRGVIKAESNYEVNAVSSAGAQGLMQLMPATAKDLGVDKPFDIHQNIDAGVRYLRQMLDMFDGNLKKALSAYNAGPATVKRYNGDVPFSETRQYVERVIENLKKSV